MAVRVARVIARFLLVALAKPPVDDPQLERLTGSSSEEKCPHCGARYPYSSENIAEDGSVSCQNCGKRFKLERLPHDAIDSQKVGMLCPLCKGIMEKGNLVGGGGIYWNKQVPRSPLREYDTFGESFGPLSDFGGEPLSYHWWSKRSPHLPAFRCRTCGIVLIKVSLDQRRIVGPGTNIPAEKCPYCAAVFSYRLDKIDSDGVVACQNCGRRFQLLSVP
jgi:predicted Zn finger-like uncharacterized protein